MSSSQYSWRCCEDDSFTVEGMNISIMMIMILRYVISQQEMTKMQPACLLSPPPHKDKSAVNDEAEASVHNNNKGLSLASV